MIKHTTTELTGWIGVVLILGAYLAIVAGWVTSSDWRYLVANGVGSVCIIISSWVKKDTQPVVLNLIWLLIAVIGLVRYG